MGADASGTLTVGGAVHAYFSSAARRRTAAEAPLTSSTKPNRHSSDDSV